MYEEWAEVLNDFSPEDYKAMMQAIINYALYLNYIPEFKNPMLKGVWMFIQNQIDKDLQTYKDVCKRNAENGKKGGRPRKTEITEKTQSVLENPNNPKNLDSDIDIDSDCDIDYESESESVIESSTHTDITIPCSDGSIIITPEQIEQMQKNYKCNITNSLINLAEYLTANPDKIRSRNATKSYARIWLKKDDESYSASASSKPNFDYAKAEMIGACGELKVRKRTQK